MIDIKKIILGIAVTGLLSGCGSSLEEQIEGVKWQADGGKALQFLRFVGGEMQHCSMRTLSQWKIALSYEVDGRKLIMMDSNSEKKIEIDVVVEGNGDGRILIIDYPEKGVKKFAVSTANEFCPT